MVSVGTLLAGAAGGATITIVIRALDEFSDVFKNVNKSMLAAGTAITAFGVAGATAISAVVNQAAKFEQTTTAFTTLLGSEELALAKLKELSDFAARTPFTIPGVERAARQLLAVGFEADELIPILKNVGDVSAGLGLGEEGLQRLILNLGQVKTQGKLTGRELRDFAVAGVPLLDELAKGIRDGSIELAEQNVVIRRGGKAYIEQANNAKITKEEVAGLVSAGKIGFAQVEQAFANMSSEGGRFFDLMDKQSKTFLGQVSNIQDSLIKIARIMGEVLLPVAKKVAGALQNVASFFESHPTVAKYATILLAVATGLALVIGPLLILVALIPAITAGFALMGVASFTALGPIALVAAAIVGLIALGVLFISEWGEVKSSFINDWNEMVFFFEAGINKMIGLVNTLISALNRLLPSFLEVSQISPTQISGSLIGRQSLASPADLSPLTTRGTQNMSVPIVVELNGQEIGRSQSEILFTQGI